MGLLLSVAGPIGPSPLVAQERDGCTLLCSPELKFEPTWTVENLFTGRTAEELDAALVVFNWLPDGHWLRNIEVEGSLDYVATGLPEAGDEVPAGEQLFLDDASPWSFSALLVLPVAPLDP